jgi:hypothetical protein
MTPTMKAGQRAEGVVHYNDKEQCWVAEINWSAIQHASDKKTPGRQRA